MGNNKVSDHKNNLIKISELASDAGFINAVFDANILSPDMKVRAMCEDNRCQRYNRSWSCPPACGTVEQLTSEMSKYKKGILLVSVFDVDGDFDLEGIKNGQIAHVRRFDRIVRQVRFFYPSCMPMSAGSCSRCQKCTYPDAPCRFPDRLYPSMEACGLLVSKTCEDCGLKYNNGPSTITFVSSILLY